MTWWVRYHPTCEYCGDVYPEGAADKRTAALLVQHAGWQAFPTQWIHQGVTIDWDFYCPTHLRDDFDG